MIVILKDKLLLAADDKRIKLEPLKFGSSIHLGGESEERENDRL